MMKHTLNNIYLIINSAIVVGQCMASTVEAMPHSFDNKNISLYDLIVFELLLEIDALDSELGKNWKPLSSNLNTGSAS
ncbi:MAG: hypothetical protein WKG06_46495 [Segetibacter sp.]